MSENTTTKPMFLKSEDVLYLESESILAPLKEQAIKLILEAATPNGIKVSGEDAVYFVTADGTVTLKDLAGSAGQDLRNYMQDIHEVPADLILFWTEQAALALAKRKMEQKPSEDTLGLGM